MFWVGRLLVFGMFWLAGYLCCVFWGLQNEILGFFCNVVLFEKIDFFEKIGFKEM